jgi:hypothetical protein
MNMFRELIDIAGRSTVDIFSLSRPKGTTIMDLKEIKQDNSGQKFLALASFFHTTTTDKIRF